jgi:hypothetical protein
LPDNREDGKIFCLPARFSAESGPTQSRRPFPLFTFVSPAPARFRIEARAAFGKFE